MKITSEEKKRVNRPVAQSRLRNGGEHKQKKNIKGENSSGGFFLSIHLNCIKLFV